VRANRDISPPVLLGCTQKLLDRVLFCSFCEDRGLLPTDTIGTAYAHSDPYNPRPIWENFRGLFHAIDKGNSQLKIPAYNGGLFAPDPVLDALAVPDPVCVCFRDLASYDYRPAHEAADSEAPGSGRLIDVEILGHIFEQSITDLERLRRELDQGSVEEAAKPAPSRRKKEGAFYTPAFITRYLVGQALGGVLADRFARLRQAHHDDAKGVVKSALAEPRVYNLEDLKKPQREALIHFWETWLDELTTVRLVDPACGSGAFLIEAFDQLFAAYTEANERLGDLRGTRTLFDPDRQILQNNLYGEDLNDEAIDICRLNLWIKTAQHGKALTDLDHTIRVGNSVIDDPAVHPKAFDWHAAFPEVFAAGGFDAVVGNPPYVRQELLSAFKPYLLEHFETFHGMADLYVYFYERRVKLLKPGGRLSFVVTNKWMKASYGEPLRRFFHDKAWMEGVVDFGHAKQIFEDADVFPSLVVVRKPNDEPAPASTSVCSIARENLHISVLEQQIDQKAFEMPRGQLGAEAWTLEPNGVTDLLIKVGQRGLPLGEYSGVKPYRGILTGFNEAFLIGTPARNAIVQADPASSGLIKPYLRGQDVERWNAHSPGLWMIVLKSSGDASWPWADAGDNAETVFARSFPGVHAHLKPFQDALIARQDKGRFWWELRSCAYWAKFEETRIMYQKIQFHPCYTLSPPGLYGNNKTFFLPTDDLFLLTVLNSPLLWWHNWRYLPHMKDEALTPVAFKVETLPIAKPADSLRSQVESAVRRLLEITRNRQHSFRDLLDWLQVEYDIAKPTQKLQALDELESDSFVAEIKKVRGKAKPLSPAGFVHCARNGPEASNRSGTCERRPTSWNRP
jgi:hypothetical protein